MTGGPHTARQQVQRLLALVPYLRERRGIRVDAVAADFGVPAQQIVRDLQVLWFCGLPGAMTGDLIEVDMDALEGEGVIHLSNADYLDRPLRLRADEALALVVALRALREVGDAAERVAVDRAIAKLEGAAGDAAAVTQQVDVHVETADPRITSAVNQALTDHRQLHLSYYVATRDETTDRVVDPLRLIVAEGRTYLEAWCRRVEDVRLFRLDRVAFAQVLDSTAAPPAEARIRDLSAGLFQGSPADLVATVELEPPAHWVAEYFPCEEVTSVDGGVIQARIRVGDPQWLRRLALRLGGSARIVEPVELADEVRATAQTALAAYGSG